MTWGLDLDGVVWRNDVAVPGSPEAINRLYAEGIDVFYVTNSSMHRADQYVEKLERFGVVTSVERIVHGGHAVGRLIEPRERVLICGGVGIAEGLHDRDVVLDGEIREVIPEVDVVVLAWSPEIDYRRLTIATRAVLAGARLVAPNADPLYPGRTGMAPGTGALIAAIEYATGVKAEFAGKPFDPMIELLRERVVGLEWFVGDQTTTDGVVAHRLGAKFALVRSGVPARPAPDVPVALEVDDLAAVVDEVLRG